MFNSNMNDSFGERISPTAAIRAILHDYPFSASILRELLQESDDARATKQIFVLDRGNDPALMAYNDSQFQEDDWKAIQSIHESLKKADISKIGKYGVGFRACYHVSDQPQILSGSSFALLDPLRAGGMKIDYNKFKESDHCKHFEFFSDFFKPSYFPGTVIRLPLRSLPRELNRMIRDYITEELNISLLFLDYLKTIEVWETCSIIKVRLAAWTKSDRMAECQSLGEPRLSIYNLVLSNGDSKFSWRIVQTQNTEAEAKSAQVGRETVDRVFEDHKLRPDVRIAYPLFSDGYTSGRLFTFLPLSSKTDFPVHIHAPFALTSSRQSLRNRDETGIIAGSDNDLLIKWNSLLFDRYIPQAWSRLLKNLAEDAACKDIFSCWPPYCSSITSGDGLYWRNILQATLSFALQSSLAIWPKISNTDVTEYVDLKSSTVVARGKVDIDVLIALAQLGLTLVQLPQTHMEFLNDDIIKLMPRVARDQLEFRGLASAEFDVLSKNQRKILRGYFLSDEDFSNIYSLPLFPVLNGSYMFLEDRKTTTRRYNALTIDEVNIFGASAGNAISLEQLQPKVAALVREKGTTQANIDLLSPTSVVAYLSSETEPRSEEDLSKFWSWLSGWRHQGQVMKLFKANSSLRLIPTSNGSQLVSSPAFRALDNRLFEKLGLAFISPLLPTAVVQLLNCHEVIKDINNMNDFLAAIDLAGLQPLSNGEAKLVFDHISFCYRSLSKDHLDKLKKLPVFPVLVPCKNVESPVTSNTSVKWCAIDGLNIKGISPMSLIPLTGEINFLDKSSFSDPSCSLLKELQLPVLKDKDILLLALAQFRSQPQSLQVSFLSYIRRNHRLVRSINDITFALRMTQFIHSSAGTLQAPMEIVDPASELASLFPVASSGRLIPVMKNPYDHLILHDLRSLGAMKTVLSLDMVQERISYISSNHTTAEALVIARSLVSLMNRPTFFCVGLSIESSIHWLPTRSGLVTSEECRDSGRWDTDLFDEVLATLDETIQISSYFRALVWNKPLPFHVLTKQLDRVLGRPSSDVQYRKVRKIVRELASRQIGDADVNAIHQAIARRPWVPTESGTLASTSLAVFVSLPSSSCFQEIGFSQAEKQICLFLLRMGCQERPSVLAIISELGVLRQNAGTDRRAVVQQAVQLLEMLPDSITDQERASLLVPIDTGDLVPLNAGVCYYKGGVDISDGKTFVGHPLISEKLAGKIGMKHLGLDEAENDIDLGGKPITITRNTLKQYNPEQFFTEFIANASDAGAKRFTILVDDHEGPTERLLSEGVAVFQNASLVVHNDGIFSQNDFRGILQTGIGGKRGIIGHFGLGALSMFHFTELAMIVSGDYVLFMNPSKQNLSFCGQRSLRLPLQTVKRLYAGHLEPLNGLFGFDLSSAGPYEGTLFRLPLRNDSHSNQDSLSTIPWSAMEVQTLLLTEFDKLTYKLLLFTGLHRIEIQRRWKRDIETLKVRVIETTRVPDDPAASGSIKSETVTFKSTNFQPPKWLIVTMDVNIPDKFKAELAKIYDMHNLKPMRVAAALESDQVQKLEYNLFCTLPLPVTTPLPAHFSAPLILEREGRNVRIDSDRIGVESEYNKWLLSSPMPQLFLCLLERLLQVQNDNIQWWPRMYSRDMTDLNVPSKIFLDAFWDARTIKESSRCLFASRYYPNTYLTPKDAVLFSPNAISYATCSQALSKVFAVTRPTNVVELPKQLFEYAKKAQLHSVDGALVKTLLQDHGQFRWLTTNEISDLLLYLSGTASSSGLSLIPLEDGSYGKIGDTKYYVVGPFQAAAYTLFPDRLVHRDLKLPRLLMLGVNATGLSGAGMAELVQERIKPAHEFLGSEADKAWITSFWDAKLNIDPAKISHLPLIPTLKHLHFVSVRRMKEPSVTIIDAERSRGNFDYRILQKLGMTVVLRKYASLVGEEMSLTPYESFLKYMRNEKGLEKIPCLESSDHEELASWVRSKFSSTPANLADVARRLPVWHVQQLGKPVLFGALDGAIVLPASMPSNYLLPFIAHPVIDWEISMGNIKKDGCSAKCITQLLRISSGDILTSRMAYKEFVKSFLNFERVERYSLLVPNEIWALTPVERLFERHDLFQEAFRATPERLLSRDFQDIAELLGKYGLKRRRWLDLPMFKECAKAFNEDEDDEDSKRSRCEILYQYFNEMAIELPRDFDRFQELDQLKFIPRDSTIRTGYDGIDLTRYMRGGVLSPSEIVIAGYEAICWSQRGRVDPQPHSELCFTYGGLGKPTGKEVVKHLKVLAEIGQRHGRRSVLLSDLKATYKWLNERADHVSADMMHEKSHSMFLNVDNPDSDDWVWHSASSLVKDLQDVGDLHDLKGFLRNYDALLKVAGARKVRKVTAKPVVVVDKTSAYRRQFCDFRKRGFEVNVTFEASDDEYEIMPAHKSWLILNSEYFGQLFITAGLGEAHGQGSGQHVQVDVPDYSSLCVREIIDWIYIGELPESIASPSCSDEESRAKLDLALEMLKLARFWAITELHERLQEFIVNAPNFINPYWVKDISMYAEPVEAKELLRACKEFEEKNRDIIDGVLDN